MSSILDIWQGFEFASDFGATQSLHYLFHLVYKKKKKEFESILSLNQFTTSWTIFILQKSYLPHMNNHVTLSTEKNRNVTEP